MKNETKQYRLAPDAHSWNIEERTETGDNNKKLAKGTVVWKPIKYYATLEQAALGLRELAGRDAAAETTLDTSALLDAVSLSTEAVKRATREVRA